MKWSWGGDGPGYGSPIIAELGGVRQVVTITQTKVVGVDAANGTLLRNDRLWPGARTIPTRRCSTVRRSLCRVTADRPSHSRSPRTASGRRRMSGERGYPAASHKRRDRGRCAVRSTTECRSILRRGCQDRQDALGIARASGLNAAIEKAGDFFVVSKTTAISWWRAAARRF